MEKVKIKNIEKKEISGREMNVYRPEAQDNNLYSYIIKEQNM